MAITFNVTNARYANVTFGSTFSSTNGLTICTWVKRTDDSDTQHFFYTLMDAALNFWMSALYRPLYDNIGFALSAPSVLNYSLSTVAHSTWVHLAATYDHGTGGYALYRDANSTPIATGTSSQTRTISTLWLAAQNTGTTGKPVALAGFKLWNATLSTADIAAEYQYRNPQTNISAVKAVYKFANGALATDASGLSNTLTLVNSPVHEADPAGLLGDDPAAATSPWRNVTTATKTARYAALW